MWTETVSCPCFISLIDCPVTSGAMPLRTLNPEAWHKTNALAAGCFELANLFAQLQSNIAARQAKADPGTDISYSVNTVNCAFMVTKLPWVPRHITGCRGLDFRAPASQLQLRRLGTSAVHALMVLSSARWLTLNSRGSIPNQWDM